MTYLDSEYRIKGGFLVRRDTDAEVLSRVRALDARRRSFSPDDEAEDPNIASGEQDEIEIHNHYPLNEEPERYDLSLTEDDEGPVDESGEVVARFPSNGYSVRTEGNEHVVRRTSSSPTYESDRHEMGDSRSRSHARDTRPRTPSTLAELNKYHAAHYARKAPRR